MPRSIDWKTLLSRQEAAFAGPATDPAREQAVLRERAAALAAPQTSPLQPTQGVDCLEFALSGERYAIELRYISETLPLGEFTPLFCTPPFVLGIVNLRGRIVSIVDLRRFFELPAIGLSDLNRVIVVSDGIMEFGVLADSIEGTRLIAGDALFPPPSLFTGTREEFMSGVTAEGVSLLDMGRILADPRLVVHEEVA